MSGHFDEIAIYAPDRLSSLRVAIADHRARLDDRYGLHVWIARHLPFSSKHFPDPPLYADYPPAGEWIEIHRGPEDGGQFGVFTFEEEVRDVRE